MALIPFLLVGLFALGSDPTNDLVSRADLGRALQRFERAWMASEPTPEDVERINRAFDAVTLSFFGGRMGEAIGDLERLTASITGSEPRWLTLVAYRVRIEPPVLARSSSSSAQVFLDRLFATEAEVPAGLELRLRSAADASVVHRLPLDKRKASAASFDADEWPVGRYVVLLGAGELEVEVGQWFVVDESLDRLRAANASRLNVLSFPDPPRRQALVSCLERNALLKDRPSSNRTAEAFCDLAALQADISTEIAMLEKGQNPYRGRTGDTWRTLEFAGRKLPVRVYAPASVVSRGKPVPLVVVYHGAGGDENMFFEAYGTGVIRTLADRHGFLVVAPATMAAMNDARSFDTLVQVMSFDYWVDPKRITVLGHSMGAGAVAGLLEDRASKIAAAACLAGGGRFSKSIPPTLVVAAEHDPLANAQRLQGAVKRSQAAGAPVELWLAERYGHTVFVGDMLPEIVAWLLGHSRD